MDHQVLAAIIQGGATVAAGGLAAWIVFFQIGRQARGAIEQAKLSEALKLKLDIYRQITSICGAHEDASISFAGKLRTLKDDAADLLDPDHPKGFPRRQGATWQELSELSAEVQRTAIAVITLIEQWQIVEPRTDLFKLAMNVALHEVRQALWGLLDKAVILPPAHTDAGHWDPPLDMLSRLWSHLDVVLNALMNLDSWVSDFQLEMQNQLVGELFDRKLSPREPLDPRLMAIRLDRYDELKAHLENETAWGREVKETNRRVLADLRS